MKNLSIHFIFFLLVNSLEAQHLEVQGDAKIDRIIQIADDSQNLIIGSPSLSNTGNRNVF